MEEIIMDSISSLLKPIWTYLIAVILGAITFTIIKKLFVHVVYAFNVMSGENQAVAKHKARFCGKALEFYDVFNSVKRK